VTISEDRKAAEQLRKSAAGAPLLEEAETVERTVEEFGNHSEVPEFMRGLPGVLAPLRLHGVDRVSGALLSHGDTVPYIAADEAMRVRFRADLAAIAAGRPGRALKARVAADADRVEVMEFARSEGGKRRKRARYLVPPDLGAAIAYVLDLIIRRQYGRRLAQCQLEECNRFFFQGKRRGHPDRYCPGTDHSKRANELDAKNRARDSRARKRAVDLLVARGFRKSKAQDLVKTEEVNARGLTAEERVQRAEVAAKAAKPKVGARHGNR
jgi:hypothetical protein